MDFKEALTQVYYSFMVKSPFYFYLLQKVEFIADDSLKCILKNRITPLKVEMLYNPTRTKHLSLEDLEIQIEHNLLHLVYSHHLTREGRDPKIYHRACDFIINHNIQKVRENYDTILDPEKNHFMAGECLLPILFDNKEFLKAFRYGIDMNNLTSQKLYEILYLVWDKVAPSLGGNDEVEFDLNDNEKAMLANMVKEAFEKVGGVLPGNTSGELFTVISDSFLKTKTDYKRILQNFVGKLKDETQRTWTRQNRRYPNQTRGKRKFDKPQLCVVIDTSGSMWSEKLFKEIASEINLLSHLAERLWIVCGDTQLQSEVKLKGRLKPESIKFKGGGGTCLQFGWDFAKEKDVDAVIVYTDGYIGQFNTYNLSTVFMLTQDATQDNVKSFPHYRLKDF